MLSVPAARYASVVRLIFDVALVAARATPVERPTLSANAVAVLMSCASTESLAALIVPPAANALVVPLISESALTTDNAPPKPTEPETAAVVGSARPVNAAWMLTLLPLAVSDPPVRDAVTFGWIRSSVSAPAPAAAIAPNAAERSTEKVVTVWFALARTSMSPSAAPPSATTVEPLIEALIDPPIVFSAREIPIATAFEAPATLTATIVASIELSSFASTFTCVAPLTELPPLIVAVVDGVTVFFERTPPPLTEPPPLTAIAAAIGFAVIEPLDDASTSTAPTDETTREFRISAFVAVVIVLSDWTKPMPTLAPPDTATERPSEVLRMSESSSAFTVTEVPETDCGRRVPRSLSSMIASTVLWMLFELRAAPKPAATVTLIPTPPAAAPDTIFEVALGVNETAPPEVTFESLIFARTIVPRSLSAFDLPTASPTEAIAPVIANASAPAKEPISDVSLAETVTSRRHRS